MEETGQIVTPEIAETQMITESHDLPEQRLMSRICLWDQYLGRKT